MRDTIELAREAGLGWAEGLGGMSDFLKAFAELVRADERERVMNEPLTKAQWQRFEDEIRADEREAMLHLALLHGAPWHFQDAIRARTIGKRAYDRYEGETK
jgi:hypothetical protein